MRYRDARARSVERIITGMPSPPEIEHTRTKVFYSSGCCASESSGAWQAFQGRHVELVQTFGIAGPVDGYDLATGDGEAHHSDGTSIRYDEGAGGAVHQHGEHR